MSAGQGFFGEPESSGNYWNSGAGADGEGGSGRVQLPGRVDSETDDGKLEDPCQRRLVARMILDATVDLCGGPNDEHGRPGPQRLRRARASAFVADPVFDELCTSIGLNATLIRRRLEDPVEREQLAEALAIHCAEVD